MEEIMQQFQFSVKIEMTAKGLAMVTVHCYSNDLSDARESAVAVYQNTIQQLRERGLPVAEADKKNEKV